MLISPKDSVLFVCRGNFCRSPMAEGSFRYEMRRHGLIGNCDSAGTTVRMDGASPDARAKWVAGRHSIDISEQRSRSVNRYDFHRFTYILAMDQQNLMDLQRIAPLASRANVCLLFDMMPGAKGMEIQDPFGGTASDFSRAWFMIQRATAHLAREMSMAVVF